MKDKVTAEEIRVALGLGLHLTKITAQLMPVGALQQYRKAMKAAADTYRSEVTPLLKNYLSANLSQVDAACISRNATTSAWEAYNRAKLQALVILFNSKKETVLQKAFRWVFQRTSGLRRIT